MTKLRRSQGPKGMGEWGDGGWGGGRGVGRMTGVEDMKGPEDGDVGRGQNGKKNKWVSLAWLKERKRERHTHTCRQKEVCRQTSFVNSGHRVNG